MGSPVSNARRVAIRLRRTGTTPQAWYMYVPAGSTDLRFYSSNAAADIMTLDNSGNLSTTGNIAAKYQDIAEWVPSQKRLEAGTVVVINRARLNEVTPSARAYDTSVAGVVSEKPGVILGESAATKSIVATTGRVRVRVDATAAPISVGDLLVTSDIEGAAMKSQPIVIGGVPIHRPGTIIGKALEPLPSGKGEILVLLSLQ